MKRVVCLLLSIAMVLSFAGCGNGNEDLKEITVVLDWTPNTNHAGLYLAQSEGYYEAEGLKVNIIQPPEGGSEALVASGKAQFGISFQDSMAPALANDKPLPIVAVAAVCQHNLSGIISKAEKGIKSFKDLEGKTYATWGSPVEQTILKYCMDKDGGDFTQLDMIESTVTDVFTALDTNMIDTIWVYEYWDVVKAELMGFDYSYIDFKNADAVMDYYTPVIIAGEEYVKEEGETVKKFLAATKRGYEECCRDIEKAADALIGADETLDRELVLKSMELLRNYYVDENGEWGKIDAGRWNGFYIWLYENKLVEKSLENIGFDMAFLN